MRRHAVHRVSKVVCSPPHLETCISQAIRFLGKRQLPHGEFQTFAARNESLTAGCHPDSALFVTALVLYALGASQDPRVPALIERGLDFLADQIKGAGLWSYWSTRSEQANYLPPDLDDTCCISFLMRKYSRPLPANQSLILANRSAGGLFYTWLAARHKDTTKALSKRVSAQIREVSDPDVELVLSLSGTLDNIDCAVNANVLLYLGDIPETQSAVDYMIETVLQERVEERSTFYPSALAFYYFLSRPYANGVSALEPVRAPIVAQLQAMQADTGSFGNALATALAACTLLNLNEPGGLAERAVSHLLGGQKRNGSWARHALFLGPAPYYGSEELTTALAVEALSRYRDLL